MYSASVEERAMMVDFFVVATVLDVLASIWMMVALFTNKVQHMPKWHRAGLALGAFGLIAQATRNIEFLVTGVSPHDSTLPLWFLKDLGYIVIAGYSVVLVAKGRIDLSVVGRMPEAPPAPKVAKPPSKLRAVSKPSGRRA
jgi:hypothetical protein